MSSVGGWSEAIIFSLLIVSVMGIVVGGFNYMYGQNVALPFNDNTNTTTSFIENQENANEQIAGGEALFDAREGLTLKSSWAITKNFLFLTWNFLSGGWIENIFSYTKLGDSGAELALFLRILYVLSLILAILYVLFKVPT